MEPITTARIVQYLQDHKDSSVGMKDKDDKLTKIVSLPFPPPDLDSHIVATISYQVGNGAWISPEEFEHTYLKTPPLARPRGGSKLLKRLRAVHSVARQFIGLT
jgi:hypothetical protein